MLHAPTLMMRVCLIFPASPANGPSPSRIRGVVASGCSRIASRKSPFSILIRSVIRSSNLVKEPGKGAVRRAVSNLFYAWSVDAQGLLPWLATAHALKSFGRQLPPRWGGNAYRMGQVKELGEGSFEASVQLVMGNAGRKDAAVRPITLV